MDLPLICLNQLKFEYRSSPNVSSHLSWIFFSVDLAIEISSSQNDENTLPNSSINTSRKKAQSTFLRESLSPRRHCRRHRRHCRRHRPRQDRRPRRQRHCLN